MGWEQSAAAAIRLGIDRGGRVERAAAAAGWRLCRALERRNRPITQGRLATGSRLLLDVRDPAHRQIFLRGYTELATVVVVRSLVRPGWQILDIGANAGFYSFLCCDLGAARALAFEPNPHTAALLERSARGTSVQAVRAACGDHDGTIELYFSPDPSKQAFATTKANAQQTDDVAAWGTVNVRLVTVDGECAARALRPDLIKIDAEGAELDVIHGMSGILERREPQALLCEVAAGWERPDPSPWLALLRDAGYRPSLIEEGGRLSEFHEPRDRTSHNVIFLRD